MSKKVQFSVNNENAFPTDYDTGWIKITTFFNGASHHDEQNSPVSYRRIGNIVYLNGLLSSGSSGVQFFLPEGFRPVGCYRVYPVRYGVVPRMTYLFVNYDIPLRGAVFLEENVAGLEISLAPVSFVID